MANFVMFLCRNDFPFPEAMAQLSVWAQFSVGMAFVMGLFTRWAGIVCVTNFSIAFVVLFRDGGMQAAVASGLLAMTGLYLAMRGAGRFGLDSLFEASVGPREVIRSEA